MKSKRRFLRLGPGLAAAMAIGAFILWQRWRQEHTPRPVVIEHQTVTATSVVGVPDPPFVLDRADALRLSTTQREQVAATAKAYQQAEGQLLAEADAAMDEAAAKLAELQRSGKRPVLSEASAQAQRVQETSGRVAEARRAAWPKLAALLTTEQAEQAKAAWGQAHTLPSPAAKPVVGGKG